MKRKEREQPEIPTASMADIAFLLIIYFMLTTVFSVTKGLDFSNMDALQEFMVRNARQMGTAGKILFPIPNRRVSKRLYRQTAPTLVVWGTQDKFIPLLYAERWCELLPDAQVALIEDAGHMVPYQQTDAVRRAVADFLER